MNETTKVWDPLVRILHWGLAIVIGLAFLLEDDWLYIHVILGYSSLGFVAIRLIWGIIGSGYARFSTFVTPPATVLRYLVDVIMFRAHRYIGHNPAAGAMVLALLSMVTLTGLSGLALYAVTEFSGPLTGWMAGSSPEMGDWLEEVHAMCANFTMLLVGLHVLGVTMASLQHQENLIWAMITGRKAVE